MLMNAIPGDPGQDYPILDMVPDTQFSCRGRVFGGYYADPETQCQVFHVCGRRGEKYSFLCPHGTIFNQNYLTCDFWFNSDCSQAESLYGINDQIQSQREDIDNRQNTNLPLYRGQNQDSPPYRGPDQELPSYGRGQPVEDQLPGYTKTRGRGQAGYRDQYGRDAKSLELQETLFLTTPPTSIMEDEEMQVESKKKRELNLSRRRTKKYSWAYN